MKPFPLVLLVLLCAGPLRAAEYPCPKIQVFFSPQGGCTDAAVTSLREARQSVLVQAYSFTSAPIAKALVEAHRRGVHVTVILDKSQRTDKYSSATFLEHMGIPTLIDHGHGIAHNKIMIIDGRRVITGSFNFTKAAEQNNAENLLIIDDPDLAAKYLANWKLHARHCERLGETSIFKQAPKILSIPAGPDNG